MNRMHVKRATLVIALVLHKQQLFLSAFQAIALPLPLFPPFFVSLFLFNFTSFVHKGLFYPLFLNHLH